jgi:hypothetical protein
MFTRTCFCKTRIVTLTSVGMVQVPDVNVYLDPGSGTECGPRHWLNVEPEAMLL